VSNHVEYIKKLLDEHIKRKGLIEIATNLNLYMSFDIINKYAEDYAKNFIKNNTMDKSRQEKASKDSVIGRLVEETIIYLLDLFFKKNGLNFVITNNKIDNDIVKNLVSNLCIKKANTNFIKKFDTDIIIYNNTNFNLTRRIFILSVKGTTRERIGQFLSHLFLMSQDVLNAKYGKNKYEVFFEKENIKLKYAFVTFDWSKSKDFIKFTNNGKKRESVRETEVQLILDDKKLGGGIYVLNNMENFDGIGNFTTLAGVICDYLKN
jgi:hypothetical protein